MSPKNFAFRQNPLSLLKTISVSAEKHCFRLFVEKIEELVNHCRLSGIDAIIAPGAKKVAHIIEMTQGRLPVIGEAGSQEEALECLNAGASLVETTLGPIGLTKLIKTLSQK